MHHGLHHSFRFHGILCLHVAAQGIWNDLPRYSKLVLEPSTAFFLSVRRKLFPIFIDFLLSLALHEERYGRREGERRTAIQAHELLSVEFKRYRHYGAFRHRAAVSPSRHIHDSRVLK